MRPFSSKKLSPPSHKKIQSKLSSTAGLTPIINEEIIQPLTAISPTFHTDKVHVSPTN